MRARDKWGTKNDSLYECTGCAQAKLNARLNTLQMHLRAFRTGYQLEARAGSDQLKS